MEKRIFAFDIGKASIGYAVLEDNEITAANSILIEPEHGEIKSISTNRRIIRTKEAHKAREDFLNELWNKSNLEVLSKYDPRFKKEFPSKNENTIYNSTLLRIALLQNKSLEIWQIYKALHAAIQRRGYDPDLPWKRILNDDDKENIKLLANYTQENDIELINSDEFQLPCYYDALRLGLWSEENPQELKKAIPFNNFNKIRNNIYVAPRELVEKELSALWQNAKKQLPQLEKISTEEFLYGNYREAYGSYKNRILRKFMGKKEDWTGVLGQKIPRFNNRIISKCNLLPKRNVCKAETIENVSTVLLMKLKNLRLTTIFGDKIILNSEQINQIYQNWLKKSHFGTKLSATITKDEIQKVLDEKIEDKFEPLKANLSGRSSFCRRACNIINKIILEGIEPTELDVSQFCDSKDTKDGIFEDEIKEMLKNIGSWNNLYVSDNRNRKNTTNDLRQQIDKIIGSISNPIVRNRLQIFRELLFALTEKHGIADEIVLEFPRQDSIQSNKLAKNYEKRIKEGLKENQRIKEQLKDADKLEGKNFIKIKLMEQQKNLCVYSGKRIDLTNLDEFVIDHIFPYSRCQCDAIYNKALCHYTCNEQKGNKTPYEWLKNTDKWEIYLNRINQLRDTLENKGSKDTTKNKKYQLLISPTEICQEIIENYNALAETGYISRMAQEIASLIFDWNLGAKNEKKHIFINTGFETAAIRKSYDLNKILGKDKEKNRENKKHHALDAICIGFSRNCTVYLDKNNVRQAIIKGVNKNEFKNQVEKIINEIVPYPYTHKKPFKGDLKPKETIYGKRKLDNETYALTYRIELSKIEQKETKIKSIFDKVIKEDLLEKSKIIKNKEDWEKMLEGYFHPKKKTLVKKVRIIEIKGKFEKDLDKKERIDKYCDFGHKGTFGQFKHSKRHKGQILYYDEKNNIKVMPIFANQKTGEVKEKLASSGYKLYLKGFVFHSGMLVKIPNDFKGGKNTYPKGIYKLCTIKTKGEAKIENNNGIEISTSAKYLTDAGFKKANIDF